MKTKSKNVTHQVQQTLTAKETGLLLTRRLFFKKGGGCWEKEKRKSKRKNKIKLNYCVWGVVRSGDCKN